MGKYFLDPLYGVVQFRAYVWDVLTFPELQRLREVRLCNVNSLLLTGAGSVSRFEHAIGTAHLLEHCIQSHPWGIDDRLAQLLVLAGLLHDIGSGPFGHSFEYVVDKQGFDHEAFGKITGPVRDLGSGNLYHSLGLEPIYEGLQGQLAEHLASQDLDVIDKLVRGHMPPLSDLLNSAMDLDNIDNVFRMAYHMGLEFDRKCPVKLASSLWISNGELVFNDESVCYVNEWLRTRQRVYDLLLVNVGEFSAKCMLQEALENALELRELRWKDVDRQLLANLKTVSADNMSIVNRLMIGDLYGCVGLYSTGNVEEWSTLQDAGDRRALETRLVEAVKARGTRLLLGVHAIRDVAKTQRAVRLNLTRGGQVSLGVDSQRILVGVFAKNQNWGELRLERRSDDYELTERVLFETLREELADPDLLRIGLYSERSTFG